MTEAQFQTKFNRWLRNHKDPGLKMNFTTGEFSCGNMFLTSLALELKLTKTKSLPFSALKEHQRHALLTASNGRLIYKIPDDSVGQKPFDCFCITNASSWVVIMFYTRGCKTFYMIPIDVWVKEEKTSKRKSLTEERANEIGLRCKLN